MEENYQSPPRETFILDYESLETEESNRKKDDDRDIPFIATESITTNESSIFSFFGCDCSSR